MRVFLLALLVALVGSVPSVHLTVTQQPGIKNVHEHFVVTGPYEGRVCTDVDTVGGAHAAIFCAENPVMLKAGETGVVEMDIHGPAGDWVLTPGLPDTPGDDSIVYGDSVRVTIAPTKGA